MGGIGAGNCQGAGNPGGSGGGGGGRSPPGNPGVANAGGTGNTPPVTPPQGNPGGASNNNPQVVQHLIMVEAEVVLDQDLVDQIQEQDLEQMQALEV